MESNEEPKKPKEMWTVYQVELRFTGQLMGGIPKDPKLIQAWLEARMPTEAAFAAMDNPTPLATLVEEVTEEVGAVASAENKVWAGFKHDDEGLYLDGYHLKAHLKDVANTLQGFTTVKALKAKLANRVFVQEERLYLGVTEPSGYWEHPVHVMTMAGPRSALKRNDYVDKPTLRATLRVLADGVIDEPLLHTLFEFGGTHGFGAERGLGHGRYDWSLLLAR